MGMAAAPAASADPDVACTGDGAATSVADRATVENALLCLVNRYRRDNLLPLLPDDTRLSQAAILRSEEMNTLGYFDHAGLLGSTPESRAAAQGYSTAVGENLAMNGGGAGASGVATAYSLFTAWRESPHHNENMLAAGYNASGLGVADGCWCSGANHGLLPGTGVGAAATQMFGVDGADTGSTAIHLNFGPIPGSSAKAGESPQETRKKKCKKKTKTKHGKKKKQRCKKKKKQRSRK
jgi:hypothetical protein